MRKKVFILIVILCITAACAKQEANVMFTATIESVFENGIMVTTTDDVGFDKASVGFDKSCEIGFNLLVGQTVQITILPEIRESYPVQVTALKMELKN